LGISLGGQPVKHRQLARQVGKRVEDPPASSMATFRFSRSVPSQGTTFVFGSWVCITDGVGNFRRFLVDMKPKILVADLRGDLDKFVDDLDDLPIRASAARIKMKSALGSTSSSAKERSTRRETIRMYKIQWNHHTEEAATWETESYLQHNFPDFFQANIRT
jgi:hypothetical protein